MSNSTTNLDLISAGQAQKEATANALLDAASPAMLYGRRAQTSGGLTWGYYGGTALLAGVPTQIANSTITLTASATNYLQADPTTGAVTKNTTGFSAGAIPLYQIVAGASTVSSYTDLRAGVLVAADPAVAAAEAVTAHESESNPHAQYLTQAEADALYAAAGASGVSSVNGASGVVILDAADVGADASGTAAAAISAHAAEPDPHPGYLTQTEGDARYLQSIGAQPFDLTAFYPGVPGASAIVTRVPVARAVTFPAGLTGSIGRASVAATAQTDFDVQKNGASVGTVRFAAAATSATFIAASAVTLAAGDIISIVSPATPDATLANVGLVLAGTR